MSDPEGTDGRDPLLELVAEALERIDAAREAGEGDDGRERVVEELCAAHPEHAEALRERVMLLSQVGLGGGAAVADGGPRQFGRFRILGELGRGGMGVVFLAHDPSLDRTVAIKALAGRLAVSERARSRFEREVRAVAALEHPRIVPIYEVGQAAGVPYFAMQHVDGRTLADVMRTLKRLEVPTSELNTTHLSLAAFPDVEEADPEGDDADETGSTPLPKEWGKTYVESVCRLVCDVADALQHAHEHGVVHRDVKPSNILLDADGRAHLFDFGLARLDSDDTLTMSGDFAGTPFYVAPEQIQARGREVDARSDVYALGVTLFELLTLRRPFEGKNPQQVFRQILSRDAPAPRRFNRLVPRDLETICLAALEKEPSRRYQTAAELAADLRRFLEFRPVRARPVGWPTRAARWARRNPAAAWATSLAALIVVGLPIGLGIANVKIADEAERAHLAEERAQTALSRARAASEFVNEMLASADPAQGGRDATVRQVLDRAAAEAGERFADAPEVEADVRRTIGTTYASIGEYGAALPHLERALVLRRDLHPDADPDVAQSLLDLGRTLRDAGEFAAAEEPLRAALAMYVRLTPGGSKGEAEALYALGAWHAECDDFDAAHELFERALALRREHSGEASKDYVESLLSLGKLALWREQYDESERRFRAALSIAETRFGTDSLTTAAVRNHLGSLLRTTGRFREAMEAWEQVLDVRRRALGDVHPLVAMVTSNMSRLARFTGDAERAEGLAREALRVQEELYGPVHGDHVKVLSQLANALMMQGEEGEAVEAMERSLDVARQVYGEDHTEYASSLFDLARILGQQGRHAEAIELLDRARVVQLAAFGPDHRMVANTSQLLGEALHRTGRSEAAVPYLRDALRVLSAGGKARSAEAAMTRASLGSALVGVEAWDEAVPLLADVHGVYVRFGHGMVDAVLPVAHDYALALRGAGDLETACSHLADSIEFARAAEPDGTLTTVDLLALQGEILLQERRVEEALRSFDDALEMGRRLAPDALDAHAEVEALRERALHAAAEVGPPD